MVEEERLLIVAQGRLDFVQAQATIQVVADIYRVIPALVEVDDACDDGIVQRLVVHASHYSNCFEVGKAKMLLWFYFF